tara:strand:- start:721 stop:1296 length:576 start_codon:yes stop_codon:yes gene_type:complete
MKELFDNDTTWEIRSLILKNHASQLMSDIERAKFFNLPNGCRMRENSKIISQENLKIGENCYIGEGTILDASGKLTIGSNVSIGFNTMIATHDSYLLNIMGKNKRENSNAIKRAPVSIGENSFIGGLSLIMPGVKIGKQCIISPMSIVYDDIPDRTTFSPYKDMLDFKKNLSDKEKILDDLISKAKTIIQK